MTPTQSRTFDDSTTKGYSSLVHTIESTPLVRGIILESFWNVCDWLICANFLRVARQTVHRAQETVQYLENIEVLHCLQRTQCLTNAVLFRKLCTSLKEHPDRARILADLEVSEGDLLEGYREYAWISYSPDIRDNSLADMSILQLESIIGDDHKEAMDTVPDGDSSSDIASTNEDGSEDDSEDDEEHGQRKRLRRLECQNKTNSDALSSGCCCPSDASIDRFFYLDQDQREPYCGHCLDEFPLLKLRFCFQHVKGSDTIWNVVELNCANEQADDAEKYQSLGIQEDEFLVVMYYVQPYESGNLRFIGKGRRNP